jgi:SAM-dependent methyltransferase
MPRRSRPDNLLDSNMYSLPLRREVSAVLHFLHAQTGAVRTGLDIGFTNAGVSRLLRLTGGYWMTVEPSPQRRALVAAVLGEETVLSVGAKGELPFEDKQFEAVVLARGALSSHADAGMAIRECHRVIRTGGLLLFTVEYRKRLVWAGALDRQRSVPGSDGCYTESEVFRLLKDGFDMLGVRFSCRFWVQWVRQWVDRRKLSGIRGANNGWLRVLYGLAWLLDLPLFWTRGHQMTVCCRRKGWRGGKNTHVLGMNMPVSDAVLFDPGRNGKRFAVQKFK